MQPLFSIIIVCLNPGEKLKGTLDSVINQTFTNYEILVKDGGSTDGSLSYAEQVQKQWKQTDKADSTIAPLLRIIKKEDTGIYDAMNQAVQEATGGMVYFLNCGDCFHSSKVLEELAFEIPEEMQNPIIMYGNIFESRTKQMVNSNPDMNAFGCYRNVPCHQACFYSKELLLAHPFELQYKVRADYEQFLWCFFKGQTEFRYINAVICDYEGGGYSETKENERISASEHSSICKRYLTRRKRIVYRLIMILTLAPLRTAIARNPKTAGFYNGLKKKLYHGK